MATRTHQLQGRKPFLARTLFATALTAAAVAFGAPTASAQTDTGVPDGSSCTRIDFTRAFVRTLDTSPRDRVLVVSGLKPSSNMDVVLTPVTYIRQPEYWEVDVQGCVRGLGLPVLTPYTATLRLGSTIGTKGVEVVGATRSLRIAVPTRTMAQDGQPAR